MSGYYGEDVDESAGTTRGYDTVWLCNEEPGGRFVRVHLEDGWHESDVSVEAPDDVAAMAETLIDAHIESDEEEAKDASPECGCTAYEDAHAPCDGKCTDYTDFEECPSCGCFRPAEESAS